MQYLCVITLIYCTSSVTAVFPSRLKLNHLLLKLNLNEINVSSVEEKWIDQPFDNFDKLHENRTFGMRYLQNLEFWRAGGPIYVFIGGEGSILPYFIVGESLVTQMARDTNGAIFATEHRYYGRSLLDIPRDNNINYYKYLSSLQALADVANLIKMVKSDPKYESSPVVVVGGSYAGNLAAWMRLMYPRLVDAAVASSAPVLAKKDFHEYLDTVRYTFGKYGTKNCLKDIANAFEKFKALLKTPRGREMLQNVLNTTSDLTQLSNQRWLFNTCYDNLKNVAQYGNPSSIKDVCNNYKFFSKKLMLDLSHREQSNILLNGDALDNEFDFDLEKGNENAWTYQFCNEFGYLQTTSSEKQPFVHWSPLEYWLQMCRDFVEGDIEWRVDAGVAITNSLYGGLTPKVSKVVFTHGDMDPWRSLGVQRDLSPDAPAFIVDGTAHCDFLMYWSTEPRELTEKRQYVKQLIKKWISK